MDQPGKVANPARGQLNRENNIPLSPCVPENLVSRDGFSRPVPRQPAHLHTQAEPGAYLRDSSRVPRRRPFMKPPYVIGSVPSLSGHAIAYRWRSLPRVRRHRASKPQGNSEHVLPWQITMDQLIFASLSHTHYWYEVGMLKVPAVLWTLTHRLHQLKASIARDLGTTTFLFSASRDVEKLGLVDRNGLERDRPALLLRALAVGR